MESSIPCSHEITLEHGAKTVSFFVLLHFNYHVDRIVVRTIIERARRNIFFVSRFLLCHWIQVAPGLYLADMIMMLVLRI